MPTLTELRPPAALPGGEIDLHGSDLGPVATEPPTAAVAGIPALVTLARPSRITLRIPEGTLPGDVVITQNGAASNPLPLSIAVPMAENLHPVANPAADVFGNVYTTLSGSRGDQTPVSVFRIAPAPEGVLHELRPFAREILNPTGLAFGPDGLLYCSSRADGTVLRIDSAGKPTLYAEGLGIATGLAFDKEGALYVGDRSGTLFKIPPSTSMELPVSNAFVFATLEPSISAYHLAFDSRDTLYVTGPTTASSQAIHRIDRDGTTSVFFRGLGRAQGLAFDEHDNLYVAASLKSQRGIVRITPAGEPSVVVAGSNLIGLCFLPGDRLALATRDAVYEVALHP